MSAVATLRELIRIPSVTRQSNARIARAVARRLRKSGFRIQLQAHRHHGQKFYNVIARRGSGRPALLLTAHLDTVPPGDYRGWTRTGGDPFHPVVRRGRVYGLGSADDKGTMAALLDAADRLRGVGLRRGLVIAATYGEESGMPGATQLIQSWRGPKPARAVVGEPTALKGVTRHKGCQVYELTIRYPRIEAVMMPTYSGVRITFRGRAAHTGRPRLGHNALADSIAFMARVHRHQIPCAVLAWSGGTAPNVMPDHCELLIVPSAPARWILRFMPDTARLAVESQKSLGSVLPWPMVMGAWHIWRSLVQTLAGERQRAFDPPAATSEITTLRAEPGVLRMAWDLRVLPGQDVRRLRSLFEHRYARWLSGHFDIGRCAWHLDLERNNPPLKDPDSASWRGWKEIFKKAGVRPDRRGKPGCTEAGLVSRWGVRAVLFGPGDAYGNIHHPNEFMSVRQYRRAVDIYEKLIRHVCGVDP